MKPFQPPPWLCSHTGVLHPLNCTAQQLELPFAASVAAGTQNHPAASGAAGGQRALPATEHKHTNPNLVGQHLTFTGMPIFCQLEALPAVTLVGTINVGTLLAAGTVVTFIHICIQKQTHRNGHSASEQCFPPFPAPGDLYLPVRVTKEGLTCPYFFCSLGRMPTSLRMSVAPEFHFSICQWKHTHMQTLVSGFIGFSSLKYVIVALQKSWRTQKFFIRFKIIFYKFCHYQVSSLSKFERRVSCSNFVLFSFSVI